MSPTKKPRKRAKPEKVLVLRSCTGKMKCCEGGDHKPFTWPAKGPVACKDWKPDAECGNGLHGLLWGEGDGSLIAYGGDTKWLVVEVLASEIVDLKGKVKFPRGRVVFCGTPDDAGKWLAARAPGRAIVRGTATAGDRGTATAGYGGTATAGVRGTATAGDGGEIRVRWYDQAAGRYRVTVGYAGEDGIKPNVAYVIREKKLTEKAGAP